MFEVTFVNDVKLDLGKLTVLGVLSPVGFMKLVGNIFEVMEFGATVFDVMIEQLRRLWCVLLSHCLWGWIVGGLEVQEARRALKISALYFSLKNCPPHLVGLMK